MSRCMYSFSYIFIFRVCPYNKVRGVLMISYEPLFQTLQRKKISSYMLEKKGFSRSTYYAIKQGKGITTNTINQLCTLLNCKVSDIIEYIED